ncbi:hypothetical protein ASF62_14625 [Leifsonia sp. Leaf325]|nr:hypothetical protein ASF62_14625 [Leifsonia sp. Leaf325]
MRFDRGLRPGLSERVLRDASLQATLLIGLEAGLLGVASLLLFLDALFLRRLVRHENSVLLGDRRLLSAVPAGRPRCARSLRDQRVGISG